jgi:hypothetical protein
MQADGKEQGVAEPFPTQAIVVLFTVLYSYFP